MRPGRDGGQSAPLSGAVDGHRRITVRVKPGVRRRALVEGEDGRYVASVPEPTIDGRANAAVVALVAEHVGRPKSSVRLVAGAAARTKRVEIEH